MGLEPVVVLLCVKQSFFRSLVCILGVEPNQVAPTGLTELSLTLPLPLLSSAQWSLVHCAQEVAFT